MSRVCTGVDVDKSTLKLCMVVNEDTGRKKILGSRTFNNTQQGFKEISAWVEKKLKGLTVQFVMEATGVYHENLAYYLHTSGYPVHIVLALKSKRYMQSLGQRSKTDKIDAKGLAFMGLEQTLDQWIPASKELLKLRSLTRQVEQLQEHKTAFKNQLEGATHSAVVHPKVLKGIKRMIKGLEEEINKLTSEIEKLIARDQVLKEKYQLIKPLNGIGLMSFAVVAAETNGFTLFKNQRQLVCYSGYDIIENQSGKRVGKTKISKKGNTHIRRILHLAAWSAVKNKTAPFHQLYERVYERTGVKMKGYVAVQRKLLVIMYTLWKKNETFDPLFETSGIHETKPLFSVKKNSPVGTPINKTASSNEPAALDGLPFNQSTEALFSVEQI